MSFSPTLTLYFSECFLSGMDTGMMQQGINIQQQQLQQQQQMVGGNLPMSMSATGSLTMAGGTMTMANGKFLSHSNPVVNFINILRAAFALIFLRQKNTKPREKLRIPLSHEMLMK